MRLDAAAVSVTGGHRRINQDAGFAASWGIGVADGVGGGPAGEIASAALIHRLVASGSRIDDAPSLVARVRGANSDIGAHARRNPAYKGMATTFTGLWCGREGSLLLAHTGDSRGYLMREGHLMRQTRDDSLVQILVEQGIVREEDAMTHPRRHMITASLRGDSHDTVRVDERIAVLGDRWLLCSDGVSDYLPHELLAELVGLDRTAHQIAEVIVEVALEAGSKDNVTAVIANVVAGAPDAEPARFSGAASEHFRDELDVRAG